MSVLWPCVRQEITLQIRAGLPILACLYCTSVGLLARVALGPDEVLRSFPVLMLLVSALPSFFGACFLFSSELRYAPLLALRATTVSVRSYYQAKLLSLLALAFLQSLLLAAALGLARIDEFLLLALGIVGANLLASVAGLLAARRHKAPFFWFLCGLVFVLLLLAVPAAAWGFGAPVGVAVCSPFAGPYALIRGGLEGIPTAELFLQLGWSLLWCAAAYFLGERRVSLLLATVPK